MALSLSFVAMRKNIEELPQFISMAKSLGADDVCVSHVVPFTDKIQKEHLGHHKEICNEYFRKARESADREQIRLHMPPPYDLKRPEVSPLHHSETKIEKKSSPLTRRGGPKCEWLWKKPFISAAGNVAPCCGNVNRPVVGNIRKKSLKEIWNNRTYRKMRDSFFNGKYFKCCLDCSEFPPELLS
jgi:radical SAM protein with 4Fe4S-binding SPASM domain